MVEGTQPPPVTQETQGTQDVGQPEGRARQLMCVLQRYSPSPILQQLKKKSKKEGGEDQAGIDGVSAQFFFIVYADMLSFLLVLCCGLYRTCICDYRAALHCFILYHGYIYAC